MIIILIIIERRNRKIDRRKCMRELNTEEQEGHNLATTKAAKEMKQKAK